MSRAAPMRRVRVNVLATLMDYCTSPSFASGGFIADSEFDGSTVVNGSQQQWLVNSTLDGWTNGVWNQAWKARPPSASPLRDQRRPVYDARDQPGHGEAPYPYLGSDGHYNVFVPRRGRTPLARRGRRATAGLRSRSTSSSSPSRATMRRRSTTHSHAARPDLTPGIYHLDRSIDVKRPDTVVLGLGFPTLVPENGVTAMTVADVKGVARRPAVRRRHGQPAGALRVGPAGSQERPGRLRTMCSRRRGNLGKATNSLIVNSDDVVLDDIWPGGSSRQRCRLDDRCHLRDRRATWHVRPLRRHMEVRGDLERGGGRSSFRTRCRTTRRASRRGWRLQRQRLGGVRR